MYKSISIGGVTIPNNLFLAPMAGFTDRAFRSVCRRFGCGLVYSEMISAQSVVYDNINTKKLLDYSPDESPWAAQFFGRDPAAFYEAIRRLEAAPFDIVDINMGCPVSKVVRNGEGAALMKDPALAGRLVAAAVRASRRPVTVKIRKGLSAGQVNAVEVARAAEASGASAVAVHGRTRDQFYSGAADWDIIAAVKDAVHIPVIGNGDIFDAESAARMLAATHCDAVMAARGALGNPWLFAQIRHYLQAGAELPPPPWAERMETALEHLRLSVRHKGERTGLLEMKKQLSFYVKGHPSAALLRREINRSTSAGELEGLIGGYSVFPLMN